MKQLFLFAIALLSLFMLSCTSDMTEVPPTETGVNNVSSKEEVYLTFLQALDSLNGIWTEKGIKTRDAESVVVTAAADAIGSVVGTRLGSTLGSAIGSLFANPISTIIGYLAGRKYGSATISQLFSAAVAIFDNQMSVPNTPDYVILPDDTTAVCYFDSIGYIHNMSMVSIANHISDYQTSGLLQEQTLLDSCLKFAIPIPAIRQIFIDDSDFNLQARDCMAGIAREASRCNNGTITFSAFMTYARDMLIQQLSMDRYDADFYIDLCNDIIEGTSCLGTFQVKQYAFSFSNIVNNSNLDQETREDVYSLSNILFSSILCWQ